MPEHADNGQMNQLKKLSAMMLMICAATCTGLPAMAQGLYSPAIYVNDSVVTEFEIEQRQRFLTLLNAPGTTRDAVVESLIDEKLRAQAIIDAGLELTEEALLEGKTEFAGRVNLSVEEFVVVLEENGVAEESFSDFVEIGVAWRDYISARFGPRLQVTEEEIDQALGGRGTSSSIRVLLSEIIIPAPTERLPEVEELAQQIATVRSEAEFSEFATRYSAAGTRDRGGRLDWQSLGKLPPVLRPLLLGLAPGEVTEPIPIPDAVALFQLRGIQETGVQQADYAAIEYATYYIPGGRSPQAIAEAEKVRAQVDVCNDLYGIAQGQPEETLERVTQKTSEIPTDIALELSKLDQGETSIALTRANGQTLVFLMLCGRTAVANEDVDRQQVAASLRSSRLNAIADSFLETLRADALIRVP